MRRRAIWKNKLISVRVYVGAHVDIRVKGVMTKCMHADWCDQKSTPSLVDLGPIYNPDRPTHQ